MVNINVSRENKRDKAAEGHGSETEIPQMQPQTSSYALCYSHSPWLLCSQLSRPNLHLKATQIIELKTSTGLVDKGGWPVLRYHWRQAKRADARRKIAQAAGPNAGALCKMQTAKAVQCTQTYERRSRALANARKQPRQTSRAIRTFQVILSYATLLVAQISGRLINAHVQT